MTKQINEHTCKKRLKLYNIKFLNEQWILQTNFDKMQYNIPINNCPFCGEEL